MPYKIMTVIKRSGTPVPFDRERLVRSIRHALASAGVKHNPIDGRLADAAEDLLSVHAGMSESVTTQQIRDAVQAVLLEGQHADAARGYLLYRYLPARVRDAAERAGQYGDLPQDRTGATLFPPPQEVRKRDGQVVAFDVQKIAQAIAKAGKETGKIEYREAESLAHDVARRIGQAFVGEVPSVEQIQDMVEIILMKAGFTETAKAYILYRHKRSELRHQRRDIPEHVKKLAAESKKYFRNPLSEFIYYRTYSRWIEEEQRRETWIETVERFVGFMRENVGDKLTEEEYGLVRQAILNQEAMPSMRLLQFAGPAARRTNVCAYNCSYIAPESLQDFGEIMYISMCGTGVGFSVESRNVQRLPQIVRQSGERLPAYVIPDSKEGWSDALVFGMNAWFAGRDVDFDYSKIRPAGARLKTMGGRSSGPEPLRALLEFTREKILRRQGRRLTNIDVHDIICKIGEVVVAGGVRRSALISLSDLDDLEMRQAKMGQFYLTEPQRSMANNSAVYEVKPTATEFMEEWLALMKSGTGERGIFNRVGLSTTLPQRRIEFLKGDLSNLGTNPCGEIILQSKQFCNLSEVVARPDDTQESLVKKVRIATILGTYQATLTNFGYLSSDWKRNCENERLLGVSITGQWDSEVVRQAETLALLREEALKANRIYAERLGVKPSTCITCVKPSGNLSQLVDAASGLHPRHAKYYIRRVRVSHSDSLFKMLQDQKVPYHPEVGQTRDSATTYVLEFPMKAPEGAIFKDDVSAMEQLEYWKRVKREFTEHNPSVTISIGDEEWVSVANWLYENWDMLGGLSFLPRTKHAYRLAPYEEISEGRYQELAAQFPAIDFSQILAYEKEDETAPAVELACAGGACEIEYLPPQENEIGARVSFEEELREGKKETDDSGTLPPEQDARIVREQESAEGKTEPARHHESVSLKEILIERAELLDRGSAASIPEPARIGDITDIDEFTARLRSRVRQALEGDQLPL